MVDAVVLNGKFLRVSLRHMASWENYSNSFLAGWCTVSGDALVLRDDQDAVKGAGLVVIPWDNVAAIQVQAVANLDQQTQDTTQKFVSTATQEPVAPKGV